MALLVNTNETGQANGTDVTTGNSGGNAGDAWGTVLTTGGTLKYSTSYPSHGTLSLALKSTSNADCYVNWATTAARTCAFRFYFQTDSVSFSACTRSASVLSATPTYYAGILIDTTGHLAIQDTAGVTKATTTGAFSANTVYRIEASVDNSGGSAAGVMVVNAYIGDSTSPISNMQITVSASNFGGGNIANFRLGRFTGTAATGTTFRFDDVAFRDGSTTLIGPSKVVTLSSVSATSPSSTTATVTGSADAGTLYTTWQVNYGTTASYGSNSTGGSYAPNTTAGAISETLTGLTSGTLYHYRIAATNSLGTTYSPDDTFVVMSPPAPVTYQHKVVIG